MLDKKVKDSIRKNEKEKKMIKAKQLGANAPLNKYYREQIRTNTKEINGAGQPNMGDL